MLVLSRKAGQDILISPGIVIRVVDINRNRVKIGIEAPKDTKINRREVEERNEKDSVLSKQR